MTTGSRAEQFVSLVLMHQRRLHAFIRALVPESADVDDLFQQTSAVLWRRFDDFEPGTNFAAWAMTIARNQVRDHRKRHLRRRGIFSDDLFDAIADKIAIATETVDARQEALSACLRDLPADARQLIELRYAQEQSVESIAATLQRSDKTVYRLLAQIRSVLLSCVENRMQGEPGTAGPIP
jgi:RNA polymerase sigma-70 factor, ECF subfamily